MILYLTCSLFYLSPSYFFFFFFFNDTATTEIYTLSLHDALPISRGRTQWCPARPSGRSGCRKDPRPSARPRPRDRKSTRLNSSHVEISYAVFCLKKKKNKTKNFHNIERTLTPTGCIKNKMNHMSV